MNVEPKYYTPSIEEFHVGFEYEYFVEDKNIWSKETFYLNKSHIDLVYFVSLIGKEDVPQVRVKYLDKEDIESLGWEIVTDQERIFYRLYKYELYYFPNNTIISINDIIAKTQIFRGTIKNKSELKNVMQQLGIE